ncbi:MAG: hypothetical protein ACE5JV_02930 [Nitrososphaerales archaeon]
MRGSRACPVCPECGSKKFKRIISEGGEEGRDVMVVECLGCSKKMKI